MPRTIASSPLEQSPALRNCGLNMTTGSLPVPSSMTNLSGLEAKGVAMMSVIVPKKDTGDFNISFTSLDLDLIILFLENQGS